MVDGDVYHLCAFRRISLGLGDRDSQVGSRETLFEIGVPRKHCFGGDALLVHERECYAVQ